MQPKENINKNKRKKYILFGSGIRAKRILRVLENIDIEFIIDNDKSKWNDSVNIHGKDYRVLSPEVLRDENADGTDVIIGSTNESDMLSQLADYASAVSKRISVRKAKIDDVDITFDMYIASFLSNDNFNIHHSYSDIPADRLFFTISDKPCAISLDSVIINGAETGSYREVLKTNGEWGNENTIQFVHYGNPVLYIEKHDGINEISAGYHFIEIDYKKAFNFVHGFLKNLIDFSNDINPDFIPDEDLEPVEFGEDDVKPIAYYLPQFHQIPRNDDWWEKGFTEWTNVTKVYPLFEGHYQPHLPIDMGFYDLNNVNVQKRQIELAKKYGIYGFCYYYYHFENGKLLDMPLNRHLQDKELDFPFCIFWDTEDWTKRWVGDDATVLRIGQSDDFYLDVIKGMMKYLKDPRYIRIGGKPLIIIYRPLKMVNPDRMIELWRGYCLKEGLGEIHLMCTKPENQEYPSILHGFDGINDFIWGSPRIDITHTLAFYKNLPQVNVYSYKSYIDSRELKHNNSEKVYKTALVNFDNSARYKNKADIYHGATPSLYKEHIARTIKYTRAHHEAAHRFMFIFAWNEWAEGAHLEPDRKYGYAWLKATREAILESRGD